MRYAFFTNTPAQVHLYKHVVDRLRERGHSVLVLARDYGCTEALLDYHDLPYETYGACGTSKSSVFLNLPNHYRRIFGLVRRFDPDLLFGMGGYAAHAGFLSRTPVVLIFDSEPTTLDHLVSRPFARAILTPHAFRKDLGAKHYRFTGFKETAYLHPDVYEPNETVCSELGVGEDERYALSRFNAFGSHPALLHDALAEADLLVADSQTTVTEAALLGTPAIRSNSWVGEDDMGNFQELESQGLVRNIAEFDEAVETAVDLLTDPDAKSRWRERRAEYMQEQVNLTDLIVAVAENHGAVEQFDRVTARSPVGDST
jgi:predicted glycosyltransferase